MKTLPAIALALLVAGCGTLLSSNPQAIPITSDPSGARVSVDGQERGVTPIEVNLPVEKDYEVKVEAEGYPPATRIIQRRLSVGYIIGDVLFGLVPLAIDVVTDSLYHLDPEDMHFQFAAKAPPPAAAPVNASAGGNDALRRLRERRAARDADKAEQAGSGSGADAHCCLNGRYYDCPDLGAVAQCAPPELAGCLMGCGVDMSCPEECLEKHKPDPSRCTRQPGNDGRC